VTIETDCFSTTFLNKSLYMKSFRYIVASLPNTTGLMKE